MKKLVTKIKTTSSQKEKVSFGRKKTGVKINRQRIFTRDRYTCVYCGVKKNLTIDHILPKSRGGKNTWANMVTCCSNCNRQKGDRTPEETNLKMLYKVTEPTIFSSIIHENLENIWVEFQRTFS